MTQTASGYTAEELNMPKASPPMVTPTLRTTPLHTRHDELGAVFTDFGGWSMPVRYASELAEHHAVRTRAGLFDVSHMGEFVVEGSVAGDFLDYALSGRLATLRVGRARYTLLLDQSGGILDDLIVYRLAEERFLIIANAGNRAVVARALGERAEGWDVTVADVSDEYALLAVQGPHALAVLESVDAITVAQPLADVAPYSWTDGLFDGHPLLVARTGYTGEDGFELLVGAENAVTLWDALLADDEHGLIACGLGARDTLRLEAGMPLHGNELSPTILPRQVGLDRVIASDKADFVGRDAATAPLDEDSPVLVGLTGEGRRAGRAGYTVLRGDDPVGEVTSGVLSPTLGYPIALAFVSPLAAAPETELTIDVRGTRIPVRVTTLPFYRRTR